MRERTGEKRRLRRQFAPAIEAMESRQVLSAMLGLTTSGQLASFDSARPDVIRSLTAIIGLQPGESVLGIDSRPATGQIYGLGSTGRLYTIDPATGGTTLVGSGPIAAGLSGSEYGIDFNPVADRLRIVSNTGLDLRVNPNTAEVVVDANLSYAPSDPGNGTTPSVLNIAYANNVAGAANTTLYGIESVRSVVVTQGSVGGSPVSPNTGQLFSVSPLSGPMAGAVGLEITPEGEALLSQQSVGSTATSLYRINLNTGNLTLVGTFATGVTLRDITSAPRVETVYAVTTGNALIAFRSNAPQTLIANTSILGLKPGETIESLDFRPSTGQLYGFGSSGRLYLIQAYGPSIGQATPVSETPISPSAQGSKPSIDFNPVADRIRFVTNANQDLRIDPNTGAVVAIDTTLAYSGSDPAAGITPSVVAQAYSNNVSDATSTTLYGIDSARDTLILQGSIAGVPTSPNTGQLFTVGALGRDISDNAGFDIASSGLALVAVNEVGTSGSRLTLVNLQTGSLTDLGIIGSGIVVRDLAIAPAGLVQFSSARFSVSQSAGTATIVVTRIAGDSGPVQVAYSTSDGTARAGVNYTAVSGVLSFADGETVKTFTVPIRENSFTIGSRTVNLALSAISAGSIIGPIGTAVLAIEASDPMPGVTSTVLLGPATAINAMDVSFRTPVDAVQAANVSNYLVQGLLAGRRGRTVTLNVSTATYDPIAGVVRLSFANPFALRNLRSLRVSARGFGPDGFDAVATYTIQRGTIVRFADRDGDRVVLGVTGRKAKVVVVRRLDASETYAWVEGRGNVIFGTLIRNRKSDRRTVIDRFVTNGARLRLPTSFVVNQVVVTG